MMTIDDALHYWARGKPVFWNRRQVFIRGVCNDSVFIGDYSSISSRIPTFELSVPLHELSAIWK